MFDTIGHGTRDEEANTRALLALLIVGVVFTSCWTSLVLVLLATSSAPPPPAPIGPEEPDYLVLTMDDEADLPELTAPAPPAPPQKRSDFIPDQDEPVEPPKHEPDEMDENVTPLEDPPKDELQSQAFQDGADDGVADGDPDGDPRGIQGGAPNGTGTRLGPPGPVRISGSDVKIRRRVQPHYPDAAKAMNLGEVICRTRIFIDAEGRPTDVQVSSCPRVFHASAREALFAWRFYPARTAGRKVPATFSLSIRYRLRE